MHMLMSMEMLYQVGEAQAPVSVLQCQCYCSYMLKGTDSEGVAARAFQLQKLAGDVSRHQDAAMRIIQLLMFLQCNFLTEMESAA